MGHAAWAYCHRLLGHRRQRRVHGLSGKLPAIKYRPGKTMQSTATYVHALHYQFPNIGGMSHLKA
jgi:hypothetical protein